MSRDYGKKRNRNPDFRARVNMPAPQVEEIETELKRMLTPRLFAPLRQGAGMAKELRNRVLTLPAMMAIVVSLVLRQVSSLSEMLRMLAREGALWLEPTTVSKQALSKRMAVLPAELFARMFDEVVKEIPAPPKELPGQSEWNEVLGRFGAVYLADGSTLESLRKKLKTLKEKPGAVLGGKMMMVVDAFTRAPVRVGYTEDPAVNDKKFVDQIVEALPVGGLLVFDLGFFSFILFDLLADTGKFFVTRLREKTAYRVVEVLSSGAYYKDEIIEMGQYRSNPCRHRVRLVSVLWNGTWYLYLTNVRSPEVLSARQVCELYRRRWRIEEAFLLTKRLLGLSYLWVGSTNGVAIQVYATWIFYAVLINLCVEVAQALGRPIEQISVEMVFRSLYHFSRAQQRGENPILIEFLVKHAQLFGLVKAIRKRHRLRDTQTQIVWADRAALS
jgi:hypothetical protein